MSDEFLVEVISYFRNSGFYSDQGDFSPDEILDRLRDRSLSESNFELLENVDEGFKREVAFLTSDRTRTWFANPANLMGWENTYVNTLKAWASISRGVFTPSNITESWVTSQGPITVSFVFDNKKFDLHPRYMGATFDMQVLDSINAIISSSGVQFETIPISTGDVVVLAFSADEARKIRDERSWRFRPRFKCTEKEPWNGFPGTKLIEWLNPVSTCYFGRTFSQLEAVLRLSGCNDAAISHVMVTLRELQTLAPDFGDPMDLVFYELETGFESPEDASSFTEGGAPQLVVSDDIRGVPRHTLFPANFEFTKSDALSSAKRIRTRFTVADFGLVRSENILIPKPELDDPLVAHRWIVGLLESACIVGVNRLLSEFVRLSSFLLTNFPAESEVVRANCEAVTFTGWIDFVYLDKGSYQGRIAPIQYLARMKAEEMLCGLYNRIHKTDFTAHLQETRALYEQELWHVLTTDIPLGDLNAAGWSVKTCLSQGETNLIALRESLRKLAALMEHTSQQ